MKTLTVSLQDRYDWEPCDLRKFDHKRKMRYGKRYGQLIRDPDAFMNGNSYLVRMVLKKQESRFRKAFAKAYARSPEPYEVIDALFCKGIVVLIGPDKHKPIKCDFSGFDKVKKSE